MITLDDLKEYLKIDITDTSQDDKLELILNSSIAFIENEINYSLSVKDTEEVLRGNNNFYLSLSKYPVNQINLVEELDYTFTVLNDITNSVVSLHDGIIRRIDGSVFYEPYFYKVNYNIGYSTVPEDLKMAVLQVALSMNSILENVKDGVEYITTPDGRFRYRDTLLTPAIESILNKYRKHYV